MPLHNRQPGCNITLLRSTSPLASTLSRAPLAPSQLRLPAADRQPGSRLVVQILDVAARKEQKCMNFENGQLKDAEQNIGGIKGGSQNHV